MPTPEATQGTQKPSAISELNNPEAEKARAEKTDAIKTGDEILPASERNAIFKKYRDFEKKELKDLGVDADKMEEELDTLGEEEEKPETEEEEHEPEGEEEEKTAEEVEGKEKLAPEKESPDKEAAKPEPEKPQGIKVEEILGLKIPVKIDGQEGEATVEDLRKSYQLQGHLTRQLQDVARQREMIERTAAQLTADRMAIENEFKEYESQLFTPEEIEKRHTERTRKQRDQEALYQNIFIQHRNALYVKHPDADKLDYDQEFVEYRQKEAPYLNEQLLANYGPAIFFPAMDLVMSTYKKVKQLEGELKGTKTATDLLKTEREKELKEREAQQRAGKLKTAKDAKPSTAKTDVGGDETSTSDGGRDYVRKMKEDRLRKQGLTPRSP